MTEYLTFILCTGVLWVGNSHVDIGFLRWWRLWCQRNILLKVNTKIKAKYFWNRLKLHRDQQLSWIKWQLDLLKHPISISVHSHKLFGDTHKPDIYIFLWIRDKSHYMKKYSKAKGWILRYQIECFFAKMCIHIIFRFLGPFYCMKRAKYLFLQQITIDLCHKKENSKGTVDNMHQIIHKLLWSPKRIPQPPHTQREMTVWCCKIR